ncbi:hypothetical protein GDO78_018796 [Eleutherodactylus coqui]|uniref:Uncharacterized protein n=1 Tax=Eleutherodactylus coqui TaxID=57060 RepID=A0A8J6EAX0_ELECQ|nr:hypothetical protein GDO78_018796 [Eleutherodactylus coqui]
MVENKSGSAVVAKQPWISRMVPCKGTLKESSPRSLQLSLHTAPWFHLPPSPLNFWWTPKWIYPLRKGGGRMLQKSIIIE